MWLVNTGCVGGGGPVQKRFLTPHLVRTKLGRKHAIKLLLVAEFILILINNNLSAIDLIFEARLAIMKLWGHFVLGPQNIRG